MLHMLTSTFSKGIKEKYKWLSAVAETHLSYPAIYRIHTNAIEAQKTY